jgi:hypothetical protein
MDAVNDATSAIALRSFSGPGSPLQAASAIAESSYAPAAFRFLSTLTYCFAYCAKPCLAPWIVETPPRCDELIADLVTASGLAVNWNQEAKTDLFAALRLLDRASPGVSDRLRAYCAERTAHNPNLRRYLLEIAARLTKRAPAGPVVVRSNLEVLRRHYTQVGR